MTTSDDILFHYSFDSKHYSELTDPAKPPQTFCGHVPDYPMPVFSANSNHFLQYKYNNILLPILTAANILYDFPISVDMTYPDVISSRRQRILFNKYHNFLYLYTHSDFIKIHMHNAWHWSETDLTINLPFEYFTELKYLFVFCGTLKLIDVCNNRDVNTFDYHSFLFAAFYLMIKDSFMLKILKGSGPVSFCLNDTVLPSLYTLLTLEFDLLCSLTWF